MHGRLKVRTTAEQERAQELAKAKKDKEFSEMLTKEFANQNIEPAAVEFLDMIMTHNETSLKASCEWYTLWNFRRTILLNVSQPEALHDYLKNDLVLTENLLRQEPKSYALWNHRAWLIEKFSPPDWEREIKLCNEFLLCDERNFHCWDYRRFVVRKGQIQSDREMQFSDNKLETNFSNYSSWHYRGCLLRNNNTITTGHNDQQKKLLEGELEKIHNAMFTDPYDQSAWLYYMWILFRDVRDYQNVTEYIPVREFYINRVLNLVCVVFLIPVKIAEVKDKIKLIYRISFRQTYKDDIDGQLLDWYCSIRGKVSKVWFCSFDEKLCQLDQLEDVDRITCELLPLFEEAGKKFQCLSCVLTYPDLKESLLHVDHDMPILLESPFGLMHSDNFILQREWELLNTLNDMEGSCKWVKLCFFHLGRLLQLMRPHIIKKSGFCPKSVIKELIEIDPVRRGYYESLCSRICIEDKLIENSPTKNRQLNLSSMGLSDLSCYTSFVLLTSLDLSCNRLTRLGEEISQCVCLEELILSDNRLCSLQHVTGLSALTFLDVANNRLESYEAIQNAFHNPNLCTIVLIGNKVTELPNLHDFISNKYNCNVNI